MSDIGNFLWFCRIFAAMQGMMAKMVFDGFKTAASQRRAA